MTSQTVPTSVKVFGILHCIFGTLGLAIGAASLTQVEQSLATFKSIGLGGGMLEGWLRFSSYLSPLLSLILLILGIGLLLKKPWGRSGSIIYSYVGIALTVIGVIITAISFSSSGAGGGPGLIGALFGSILGGIISVIYPILTIVFMRRPNVKEALERF
jgi:hypothetical protein